MKQSSSKQPPPRAHYAVHLDGERVIVSLHGTVLGISTFAELGIPKEHTKDQLEDGLSDFVLQVHLRGEIAEEELRKKT
jgi:hypothetical protein